MGFILYLLSWIIEPFVVIINFFTVLVLNVRVKGFFKVTDEFFKSGAKDRDRFGNHNYRTMLNFYMIKNTGYQFGNYKETISSVLGKNQRDKTLTWTGWFFVYLLWAVDYPMWPYGGHCISSINNNIKKTK